MDFLIQPKLEILKKSQKITPTPTHPTAYTQTLHKNKGIKPSFPLRFFFGGGRVDCGGFSKIGIFCSQENKIQDMFFHRYVYIYFKQKITLAGTGKNMHEDKNIHIHKKLYIYIYMYIKKRNKNFSTSPDTQMVPSISAQHDIFAEPLI